MAILELNKKESVHYIQCSVNYLYMIILISFAFFLGHDAIVELMEAVDTNVPDPDRNLETPFFLPVEGTHSIPGR